MLDRLSPLQLVINGYLIGHTSTASYQFCKSIRPRFHLSAHALIISFTEKMSAYERLRCQTSPHFRVCLLFTFSLHKRTKDARTVVTRKFGEEPPVDVPGALPTIFRLFHVSRRFSLHQVVSKINTRPRAAILIRTCVVGTSEAGEEVEKIKPPKRASLPTRPYILVGARLQNLA